MIFSGSVVTCSDTVVTFSGVVVTFAISDAPLLVRHLTKCKRKSTQIYENV